jgi:pimeloyl-ACP methyl ester carboxylesterase
MGSGVMPENAFDFLKNFSEDLCLGVQMELRKSGGLFLVLFMAFLSLGAQAASPGDHVCGSETIQSVPFNWCIDYGDPSLNSDFVYYMHSLGGSEENWAAEPQGNLVRDEWKRLGVASPTVISVSFGAAWLLTEVAQPSRPALYGIFVHDIMPLMESKLPAQRGRRLLVGISMGGFNSAQLLTKNGELFDRVAMVCPAIAVVSPHADQAEIDAFVERHKDYINPDLVKGMLKWGRREFLTEQDWLDHSPVLLASRLTPKSPVLQISCGDRDEFGFNEGAQAFAQKAMAMGVNTTWELIPGGHCVMDTVQIARFLAPVH